MDRIKTIIVDDEPEAREGLELLLGKDQDIQIVCLCKNGIEAIDAINEFKIDLVFLDIQMPAVDGFEVIRSVNQTRLPEIIFTTAHDQYALKAFEVHAIDYLLKPFTDKRFYEALLQAKGLIANRKVQLERQELMKRVSNLKGTQDDTTELIQFQENQKVRRLVVKEAGQVLFIELGNIIWIEAYDYYVKIHIQGRFHLLRKSMKKLEALLPEDQFVRVHKSSIINLQYIKSIATLGNGEYEIILETDDNIKVSRSYKKSIINLLER